MSSTAPPKPGFSLTRLHHVQLPIPPSGLAAARAFYCGVLGLDEVDRPTSLAAELGGAWFRAPGGLEIHMAAEEGAWPRPLGRQHPAIAVSNGGLDSLAAKFEGAGVNVTRDARIPGVRRFFVRDPFGNRIEFVEDGEGEDGSVGRSSL